MLYLKNLSSTEIFDGNPWEFTGRNLVPQECFKDKKARDAWINQPTTEYHVFSLYEGTQKGLRIRKGIGGEENDNPPLLMHGLAVDYDAPITLEEVKRASLGMGLLQPAWMEETLSGNARLLWLFQTPVRLPSRSFLKKLLEELEEVFPLKKLAGFDGPAFNSPERYFTNGGVWHQLSKYRVAGDFLEGILIRVSQKFKWTAKEFGRAVPLEDIKRACEKKYPRFAEWEGDFTVGAQGPSFWLEGSKSPKSAIVRDTGMQTFSAHASKAFYNWADILDHEFMEHSEAELLGRATQDVFYDGRMFVHKDNAGKFVMDSKETMALLFNVNRGLGTKPGDRGSEVDRALAHVITTKRIEGAASCAFYPQGLFTYETRQIINTHQITALSPAPASAHSVWGEAGGFPFLSRFLDTFFSPVQPQAAHFLSWLQYFYRSCLERSPRSGHGVFIVGPVNTGKGFLSEGVVGKMVGGFADGNSYLAGKDGFNSEMFDHGLWVIGDGTSLSSESVHRLFSENVKRSIANRTHRSNEKFKKAVKIPWQGRIFVTCNPDAESIRQLPDMHISIRDKLMVFRSGERQVTFLPQPEMEVLLDRELPHFCRWLLDWTAPDFCTGGSDVRFGVNSYCEPSILRAVGQASSINVFAEIVQKFLIHWFTSVEKEADQWEGTSVDLRANMQLNDAFAEFLRHYHPEKFTKLLVQASTRNIFKCEIFENEGHQFFRLGRPDKVPKHTRPQLSTPAINQEKSRFET